MKKAQGPPRSASDCADARGAGRVIPGADLTWLLHRAAQGMRAVMGQQAERHGTDLRGYLLLTALDTLGRQTQLALGQSLGLDKTTLTSALDRLEREGLVIRRADPSDRRARLPEATQAGRELQVQIAQALAKVETDLLRKFSADERRSLRIMLCELITGGAGTESALPGSCF